MVFTWSFLTRLKNNRDFSPAAAVVKDRVIKRESYPLCIAARVRARALEWTFMNAELKSRHLLSLLVRSSKVIAITTPRRRRCIIRCPGYISASPLRRVHAGYKFSARARGIAPHVNHAGSDATTEISAYCCLTALVFVAKPAHVLIRWWELLRGKRKNRELFSSHVDAYYASHDRDAHRARVSNYTFRKLGRMQSLNFPINLHVIRSPGD